MSEVELKEQVDEQGSALFPAGQIKTARETLDELFAKLDAKFKKWDVYRTALGEWCFHGEYGDGREDFDRNKDSFVEVLVEAFLFVPLPAVPRKPTVLDRNAFTPYRTGSRWRLKYLGEDWGVMTPTKTQAEQAADKFVERSRESHERWMIAYGWTIGKVEGQDFRYKW
jgi:hypothetical protein